MWRHEPNVTTASGIVEEIQRLAFGPWEEEDEKRRGVVKFWCRCSSRQSPTLTLCSFTFCISTIFFPWYFWAPILADVAWLPIFP